MNHQVAENLKLLPKCPLLSDQIRFVTAEIHKVRLQLFAPGVSLLKV